MKIGIYTENLPTAFRWDPHNPWRGTEEFYVETAVALTSLGHEVEVFYDGPYTKHERGPLFLPRGEFRGGFDVVLCCNAQPPFLAPGSRHVYWSNLKGDRHERHLWANDQIVISGYHRQEYETPTALDETRVLFKTHVIGHGVDADKYRCAAGDKEPIALYSSSMDRGGLWLKACWDSFGTGLRLVCTEGRLTDEEVTALYKRASVWVHPCLGVELFCISALKAQAAGCLCVYSPTMALPETIRPGHLSMALLRWRKDLAGALAVAVAPPVPVLPSWSDVTKQIETVLTGESRV